ncbi:MAG: copper homeostasis protein CutC [Chitinophagaceae bacterium]|nr:MAG: copper homeostasis protein CutC [Chitinophagaceae bacterium]
MTGLEVCANSFASALAAEKGGAIRVELCENMAEGGTTPSYGQIKRCIDQLTLAVWPTIRPRGGDFLYTDDEFEIMKEDIKCCKEMGCDGVVTGILLPNGEIDQERCRTLIALAHPMPVAMHRAFDACRDLEEGLEVIIQLGFVRILTSGGAPTAYQGINEITKLVKLADNRIEIMPGAGVNQSNIIALRDTTGARCFHSSARVKVQSKMAYQQEECNVDFPVDQYDQSAEMLVKQMVDTLSR